MRFKDHDAVGAFASGTLSSLGIALATLVAIVVAMLLVVLLEHLFGISDVNDAKSFFLLVFMTWISGLLSGIGFVLAVVDFWYLSKALREDVAGVDYFFLIASSQVGLYFCSSIFLHTLSQTWPVSALGLVVFGSLWFGSVVLRRRGEAVTLARMEREGEEFRQELRERNLQRNLKWGRPRR